MKEKLIVMLNINVMLAGWSTENKAALFLGT